MQVPEWLKNEVEDYFTDPDLKESAPSPELILDIGANIGAFALRAHAQWPTAKILCYEPLPFNLEQLGRNVDSSFAEIWPYAVGAISERRRFYIGDMFVTGSFFKGERQTPQTIEVQCLAAAALPAANIIKIDTEGAEVEILRAIDLSKAQLIMIEHHSKYDATTIKKMLDQKFSLRRDESDKHVGIMIFRRNT
jgi:FkbM family methyltransferase